MGLFLVTTSCKHSANLQYFLKQLISVGFLKCSRVRHKLETWKTGRNEQETRRMTESNPWTQTVWHRVVRRYRLTESEPSEINRKWATEARRKHSVKQNYVQLHETVSLYLRRISGKVVRKRRETKLFYIKSPLPTTCVQIYKLSWTPNEAALIPRCFRWNWNDSTLNYSLVWPSHHPSR